MNIEDLERQSELKTDEEAQAKVLMNNPLVKRARENLKKELHDAILESKHDEVALREHYWRMLKTLDDFEQLFVGMMIGGQHARKALEHYKKSNVGYLHSI